MFQRIKTWWRNRRFGMLPAAAKRVAIARDVIEQLGTGWMVPASRWFCVDEHEAMPPTQELSKSLAKITQCKVCGIGACFISAVRLYNAFIPSEHGLSKRYDVDSIGFREMLPYLLQFFTNDQLNRIEYVFEGMLPSDRRHELLGHPEWATINRHYHSRKDVMVAIMQNIIQNGGQFLPDAMPRPHPVTLTGY